MNNPFTYKELQWLKKKGAVEHEDYQSCVNTWGIYAYRINMGDNASLVVYADQDRSYNATILGPEGIEIKARGCKSLKTVVKTVMTNFKIAKDQAMKAWETTEESLQIYMK